MPTANATDQQAPLRRLSAVPRIQAIQYDPDLPRTTTQDGVLLANLMESSPRSRRRLRGDGHRERHPGPSRLSGGSAGYCAPFR